MGGSPVGAVLSGAMLLSSAVGVLCLVLQRPRRPAAVIGSLTMTAAMADMSLGYVLVPPVVWVVALVSTGLGLAGSVLVLASPRTHVWSQSVCLVVAGVMVLLLDEAKDSGAGAVAAGRTSWAAPDMAQAAGPVPHAATGMGWFSAWTGSLILGVLVIVMLRMLTQRGAVGRPDPDPSPHRYLIRLHDAAMFSCLALMAIMPAVSM